MELVARHSCKLYIYSASSINIYPDAHAQSGKMEKFFEKELGVFALDVSALLDSAQARMSMNKPGVRQNNPKGLNHSLWLDKRPTAYFFSYAVSR